MSFYCKFVKQNGPCDNRLTTEFYIYIYFPTVKQMIYYKLIKWSDIL